ncbi:GNAT family N-acetyltransferase [Streptomyces clavifer]|uniref:GNAT family N-acetyltransferase n=1 Tax=Streptomyces clavifer TaxID=68188 RepID=UPI0036B4EA60
MTDPLPAPSVTPVSRAAWERACARAGAPMPFGDLPWTDLGLTGDPALRFSPVVLGWEGEGELLVPLCLNRGRSQIGCFGYGIVWPLGNWRRERLPDFPVLARALARTVGHNRVGTLLPPAGVVPALDGLVEHWDGDAGRDTYVLDLTGGVDSVWAAARGSSRTAVRRAGAHGLTVREGRPKDVARLLDLHRDTMTRNDAVTAYDKDQVDFLLRGPGAGALTVLAEDADGVHAASVFGVGAHAAFHIMQLTSEHGRRNNAGHLAFWDGVTALVGAGVQVLDLGSAANVGQERFKANWGALPKASRVVQWKEEQR